MIHVDTQSITPLSLISSISLSSSQVVVTLFGCIPPTWKASHWWYSSSCWLNKATAWIPLGNVLDTIINVLDTIGNILVNHAQSAWHSSSSRNMPLLIYTRLNLFTSGPWSPIHVCYLTITITRYLAPDDDVDDHEQDHPYDPLDELSRFLFGNDQWMHGLLQQQSRAIPMISI